MCFTGRGESECSSLSYRKYAASAVGRGVSSTVELEISSLLGDSSTVGLRVSSTVGLEVVSSAVGFGVCFNAATPFLNVMPLIFTPEAPDIVKHRERNSQSMITIPFPTRDNLLVLIARSQFWGPLYSPAKMVTISFSEAFDSALEIPPFVEGDTMISLPAQKLWASKKKRRKELIRKFGIVFRRFGK